MFIRFFLFPWFSSFPLPLATESVLEAFQDNYMGRTAFGMQLSAAQLRDLFALRRPDYVEPDTGPPHADVLFAGDSGSVCWAVGKSRLIGGRLRDFVAQCRELGDEELAVWLLNGIPWRNHMVQLAPAAFANAPSCLAHADFVWDEIRALLAVGALRPYTLETVNRHGWPRVICGLHVVDNGDKLRLCFDFRYGNLADGTGEVVLEQLHDFTPLLRLGEYMAKLDLRSGYHHLPLRDDDAPFVCCHWGGSVYYWSCMFFGLRSAPRWFTRATRPMVLRLRELGAVVMVYIDDFILWLGSDLQEASNVMRWVKEVITSWGGSLPSTNPPIPVSSWRRWDTQLTPCQCLSVSAGAVNKKSCGEPSQSSHDRQCLERRYRSWPVISPHLSWGCGTGSAWQPRCIGCYTPSRQTTHSRR